MWLGFSLLILLVVIVMSVIISKLTGGLDITEQSDFQEATKGMTTKGKEKAFKLVIEIFYFEICLYIIYQFFQ